MSIFLTLVAALFLCAALHAFLPLGFASMQVLIVLVCVGFAFTLVALAAIISGLNRAGIKAR